MESGETTGLLSSSARRRTPSYFAGFPRDELARLGELPESSDDGTKNAPRSCSHLGLSTSEAEELLERHGKNELPEKVIPKWFVFISLFWQPMPIMIWLAIVVEISITNYLDMSILLIIQFANASIAFYEINKAGDAVAELKASLRPEALVMRDDTWILVDATLLVPGDLIALTVGAAVPADCTINEGQVDIDQAQLTGESLPITMYKGDQAKMGSTVARGEVEATVEFTGANTFFGKTASLLQDTMETVSSYLNQIVVGIYNSNIIHVDYVETVSLMKQNISSKMVISLFFTMKSPE